MRRLLSISRSSRLPTTHMTGKEGVATTTSTDAGDNSEDIGHTTAQLATSAVFPPPTLKIKRVDHYYSTWSKAWKYRNSGSNVSPEMMRPVVLVVAFCFVILRKIPQAHELERGKEITFQVVVKSPYLLKACKDVIQSVPGLSWTAEPLELDPHLLITFFPDFEVYRNALQQKKDRTSEENHILITIDVLLDYLRKDYRTTLAKIANLTSHGEITFDILYAILVPRTVLITECPITGEPRALQLISASKISTMTGAVYEILCESIDAVDGNVPQGGAHSADANAGRLNHMRAEIARRRGQASAGNTNAALSSIGRGKTFGRVQSRIYLSSFKGTVKISSLDAYPIKYHPCEEQMKASLIARGRKWISLKGIHHMHYNGTSAFVLSVNGRRKVIRYNVNSRIMVDRGNFVRLNPNYDVPVPKNDMATAQGNAYQQLEEPVPSVVPTLEVGGKKQEDETPLMDDELIFTSPIVYGFSLSDKLWLEFNVEHVSPIVWHDEAFSNLVLPADRKDLLRSLVEAHSADLGFDDFVQGKGHGLVINLFGPPGVGKTLSAEATSEHVQRPLYVIGGGDLGTKASELDRALERVFDIATSWKAIADVFLERRSLHDLERNAMVAVFLRHVEYYRGILFLTTNRIKAFDEAFLSRIHVALHFSDLTKAAKMQVWKAFLAKAGVHISDIGTDHIEKLADRDINGRQIKNATRTAKSLAVSRHEKLGFTHLVETLDAMEEFTAEFAAMGRD
ncbi:ATPase family AAA domain-containing protein 3B [Grifola frondosa]|uniref:ATPase family AAA domain-containing protein 3B n=1 Tax=Grifola frondosa TaxID=5627 RepID=A0A1C7MHD9_GRIFR|nr:ATPase family AAA domain-containing protein 3B [Grifola frondosa]